MSATPWTHVERELQRARGARRAFPFVAAAAAGAVLLAIFAGAGASGALVLLAPAAVLALLVWTFSRPRCPSCGGSLWRRGERPGSAGKPRPTEVERARRCPRCGAAFG